MWKTKRDFDLGEAKSFLLDDFLKVVKRTKFLYIDVSIPKEIGPGFFEPVALILSWCDFIGALYTGKFERKESTERARIFIDEVMGKYNSKYQQSSKILVESYRNGIVHAYAPINCFHISIGEKKSHLEQSHQPHVLNINLDNLIEDFENAIRYYADSISLNGDVNGSLENINVIRKKYLKYA